MKRSMNDEKGIAEASTGSGRTWGTTDAYGNPMPHC